MMNNLLATPPGPHRQTSRISSGPSPNEQSHALFQSASAELPSSLSRHSTSPSDETQHIRHRHSLVKLKGLFIRGRAHEQVRSGTKDPKTCVRDHLKFLQDSVPLLVRARRLGQSQLLNAVKETLNAEIYQTPAPIEGMVKRTADGRVYCKHRVIQAVLDRVETKFQGQLSHLAPLEPTRLALPLEAEILAQAHQFEQGCRVRRIHLSDQEEPLAVDINLSAYTTRQAIKQGTHAFTPEATLPLTEQSASIPTSCHSATAQALNADPHPFAFLQQVKYKIDCDHSALRMLVERALNSHDSSTLELRGRLGAHALQRVFNNKNFDWKLGAAMLLSVAGSGGIAYALDIQATARMIDQLGQQWGHDDVRTRFVAAFAESLVPTPAEIFDSSIVKRIIEKLRGNQLIPESWQEFKDDFKEALVAGLISAIGSLPSNLLQVSKHVATIPFNILTNSVATATAAAMAPIEIAHAEDELAAGVLAQRQNHFFATPPQSSQADRPASAAAALNATVRDLHAELQGALEATPGINQTINSMGIGQVISFTAGLAPFNALMHADVISEMVQKIAMIAVNQPTEVLSLATGILTGKHIGGVGSLITTDTEKNNRIAELILRTAQQRLTNQMEGRGDHSVQISEDALRAIEHPSLELTFKGGRLITKIMNDTVHLITHTVAKLRNQEPEPSLTERVAAYGLSQSRPPV